MDKINVEYEEFWRQLEVLSLKYISSKIKLEIPQNVELTRERKDGGFDGKITIDITEDSSIHHKVLFESKFRTTIKTLPLADCSKALIIAFNQAAHTLFIVTNILFSEQAKKEIETFRKKINLNIIEVDGNELKKFISMQRKSLMEQCSAEFLEYIENASDANLYVKIDDIRDESKKRKVKSNNTGTQKEFLYKDAAFKENIQNCANCLRDIGMFVLLRGNAGNGKTIFLENLFNSLEEKGHFTEIFNLQQCTTPRILFIKILESLWGIDLSEFFSQSGSEEEIQSIKSLIEFNADGKISDELSSALTQVLCQKTKKNQGYSDNYYFLLSRYIFQLLKPYRDCNAIIWAFTDLNKAEVETLDFLYTLLSQIRGMISIVIEIRPHFLLETTPLELVKVDYYHKFCTISNNPYTIDIESFKTKDAIKYLAKLLPGMPVVHLQLIVDIVGTVPLYLNTAAVYLKVQINNMKIGLNAVPEYILKGLLLTYGKHGNSIISFSLDYFGKDPQIAVCFAVTGLLDGRLPIIIIENLFESEQQSMLFEKLDNISYYTYKKDSYYVKHNFIYDAMKSNISPRIKYIAAEKILQYAQSSEIPFQLSEEKNFELLYLTGKYQKALERWNILAADLHREHHFYSIIKYGAMAIECYDNMEIEDKDINVQIDIITSILDAYLQIRIFNTENFNELMLQFETISNLNKYTAVGSALKAKYLFYKWNRLFYNANIEESYNEIIKAKKIVDGGKVSDKTLCANIYWSYALSHKRKTSIEQAIEDYKTGLKKYPDSVMLKIGLNLHEAHTYLRKNPSKVIKICENLLNDIKGEDCPYNEILQIRVDIIMAKFYDQRYQEVLYECEDLLQIAKSINAVYQIGRLFNIYAACLLALQRIDEAEACFMRSYNEFQKSGNILFGWRAIFNLSQLILEKGQRKKALNNFLKLFNNGIPNISERISDLTLENSEMVAFLYTVRILKENGQYKENELTKKFCMNKIYMYEIELNDEDFFQSLSQLSYMHNNYLIILG